MGDLSNLVAGDDKSKHEPHGQKSEEDHAGNYEFEVHGKHSVSCSSQIRNGHIARPMP